MRRLNIAMVSDFFYPSMGGIETHIKYLSEELIAMGHKVIVITHRTGDLAGCRMVGTIKVYFLDIPVLCRNTTFPSLYSNFPLFKEIFDSEEIEIVHGHQTMSNMCIEGLFHARTLNLKTVITDHSIFEVGPFENIVVNALCRLALKNIDRCICVSYTSKENTHIRTMIPLERIHVIPNAIVSDIFCPREERCSDQKTVVVASRLVFRKGIDLLIGAIPLICKGDPNVRIIIVGDGPMKEGIEQVLDENELYDRVEIMHEVDHEKVGDIMRRGDVFLNTSLTETFCIAIVEAASCGLHVVSTNVGGISEVLPPDMITFSKITSEDLAEKVLIALRKSNHNPQDYNKRLKDIYNWKRVAKMTEKVYMNIEQTFLSYRNRRELYRGVTGFLSRLMITIEYLFLFFIAQRIDCREE
ncbi:glycosyltransferase [Encephalitozoon hellem ATCC 50504]|uniref:Glycosyltransferase n=1 Tax=Encephalitozoon hellem TaxID=27973 RepID=A0A9Q9C9N2_ENCHE|nr:glycosyltransferase [Encephalitozoon hellem ATCC 50504]AFM99042.1 glycosyltransferase [Encephalitozoon hellem ATCC 50504]UTX44060.1 glycosyltransferase [Encephalitozoon hellem]WEL39543.1 glycosyltransferase [Encephalitozoon hellem]|eukprot:XP_003888023.1 glycosyltransferase [Encephalitozoon hellem ATCC 50504]